MTGKRGESRYFVERTCYLCDETEHHEVGKPSYWQSIHAIGITPGMVSLCPSHGAQLRRFLKGEGYIIPGGYITSHPTPAALHYLGEPEPGPFGDASGLRIWGQPWPNATEEKP